jgi:YidC/Oxa1 family membrane protein insertase
MQDKRNQLFFFVLAGLLLLGYFSLRNRIWPPPQKPPQKEGEVAENQPPKEKEPPKPPAPAAKDAPQPRTETDRGKLLELGNDERFFLKVVLDPRGAGVRSVILPQFKQADERGRPTAQPLELVPAEANRLAPSFVLYHFDPRDLNDDRPLDTLGNLEWTVADKQTEGETQYVAFEATIPSGVKITKKYSLKVGEYHLGLEVKLKRTDDSKKDQKFRYQLAGARGLPVEGKWYTNTFRNALIAREQNGNVLRDLQDLRQLSLWRGGNEIRKEPGEMFRYAGVAVQYFASVIVVDNDQASQNFLSRARPTLETWVTKGSVKSIADDGKSFVLTLREPLKDPRDRTKDLTEEEFHVLDAKTASELSNYPVGARVAVTRFTAPSGASVAVALGNEDATQPLWEDDITVRVSTEPIDLKNEVVHKYLLYHGPVKPSLLRHMSGDATVSPDLIDRYVNELHLNTLTDYQSQSWFGTFLKTIGWSWLVISCTNLMHSVLGFLYTFIPNLGLCIIVLTVLVRGLIFPLSRIQALTSLKMQALGPELKKLKEKHKDDNHAFHLAQMELYKKHGIKPLGTCWFLLAQMPILMGLYFSLQESILFRLGSFWPTWIVNLAAPDMLFEWGENIWWISRPQDYGNTLLFIPIYLGPYFNLLPVFAVALMIVQQKMFTPPPADEQQEMQQKLMKYMMVVFGLMFYKVAAGLCIYFIASSLWGLAERRLLPKLKPLSGDISADSLAQKVLGRTEEAKPAAAEGKDRIRGKQGRTKKRQEITPSAKGKGNGSAFQRLREWWQEVLKEAQKKER